MRYSHPSALVVLAFVSLAASIPLALAAEPPAGLEPQEGVLLLRNSQVLTGKITRSGDYYHVTFPTGECRVRASDVQLHCRTLEECYHARRAAAQAGNLFDRLDLAGWCLQQKMLEAAAEELQAAKAIDARHPRIALMQRKLELAMNPPAAHRSESQPAEAGDALPSADDLERLVRGMPAGTMETYTNTIQPLILNSCTAAGCHGPASETKYRWLRVTSGRNVNRRLTQRNLHTTMLLVNRENPDESPLLNAPAGPHGAAKAAVFTDRESIQFRQLQAWVRQVATNKEPPAQPGGLVSPVLQNPPPVANTYGQGTRPGLPQSAPSAGSAAAPTSASSSSAEDDRYAAFAGLPGAAKGDMKTAGANVNGAGPTAEGAFVPRDPFDPEIFNRRHGKGRTKE